MYMHTHSCVLAYIQTCMYTHTHAALTEEQEGVNQNFARLFYITKAGMARLSGSNLPNVKTERIRCGDREGRRGQRTHTTASFATASCERLLKQLAVCHGEVLDPSTQSKSLSLAETTSPRHFPPSLHTRVCDSLES